MKISVVLLALLDENYENILNGGYFIKSRSEVTYEAVGLQFTYSGSQSYPEYVRIEGKLTKKIFLQVNPVLLLLFKDSAYFCLCYCCLK